MRSTFDRAIEFALYWEKWKANNRGDSGGLTIWGVTERWFPEEVKRMVDMSESESREYAKEFYLKEFWVPMGCDTLEFPIDWLTFDCAMNQGRHMARSLLFKHGDNWRDFIIGRLRSYVQLPGQVLEGWENRVFEIWNQLRESKW